MLDTAIKAAKSAADILMENFGKITAKDIREKSKNDFLTHVDELSESKIIEIIHQSFPTHSILAEESGKKDKDSEYEWIIDPLDGTKNFISGIPVFAISIAMRYHDKMELGVIMDPVRKELFTAQRGKGAFLNESAIHVSQRENLSECLCATGFPFKIKEMLPLYLKSFEEIFSHCSGIRRMGAAAIDLAYLAAGRFDGFWELGLSPWDMAAGSIIIEEAGGKITDFWGGNTYLENGNVLATNIQIHEELLNILSMFPKIK